MKFNNRELHYLPKNITIDGSRVFKMRDEQGMPLDQVFDIIINEKKMMVDWLGFLASAKIAGWKWSKILGDIKYGLRDANVEKDMSETIIKRIEALEEIYNKPEKTLKKGFEQAKNGDILYDLTTIEFVITRDENLHELKDKRMYYPKDGKLFCEKCHTDLKLKEDHIITVCNCYKHEAYENA